MRPDVLLNALMYLFCIRCTSSAIQKGQYDLTSSSFLFNQNRKPKVFEKFLLYI